MLHKSIEPTDTTVDADAGTFEATVAVFNNVDLIGDRIIPGAFKNTLAKWEASGDPIPVIFNHDWGTPDAHIGVVESAMETEKGLHIKGRLDIADNTVAKQVHRLMQRRSLKEFSFGYEIAKGGERKAKDGAHDLTDLVLAEVGPTLKGMNPATELHGVKSALGLLDSEDLRKESSRLEREMSDEKIPDVPPVDGPPPPKVEDLVAELAEVKARLADAETPPPDTKALRKESERLAREIVDATIPDVPAVAPKPKEPDVDVAQELADVKSRLAAAEQALTPPPDTEELRKESQRLERELAEEKIPELPAPPAPEPDVDLLKELQEVKARLETTEQALTDLTKKAEETDKEQHARSVDPLRKRSEELALEIASDGMSLRKPPTQAPPEPPEPFDKDAVRKQSRDLMFEVLSYSTGETNE